MAAHLAHGDSLGACGSVPTIVVDVPTEPVPLDLERLASAVQGGRAHTLVLRVAGNDSVVLRAVPVAGAAQSGVALQSAPGEAFVAQALAIPRSLDGTRRFTQTDAFDVITAVTVTVRLDDGRELTASAAVTSQAAVTDPWLGAVPGEIPTLQLGGS